MLQCWVLGLGGWYGSQPADFILTYMNIFQSPSPEPAAAKSPTSPEDKGVLQRWFPGWGGWYGS